VQDRDEHDADRLAEVERLPGFGKNAVRVAGIGVDVGGGAGLAGS
jgi:hypothetical protein